MFRNTPSAGRGSGRPACLCLLLASIGLLGAAPGNETLSERQARLAKMTPAEKEQLERKLIRFRELDPAEQQRLRELDRALSSAPQADALRKVMRRYSEWLSELSVTKRSEILGLTPSKRLERVKELRSEELDIARRQLGPKDLDVLREWQEWWALRQVSERERARLEGLDAETRRRDLWKTIGTMWWQPGPRDAVKSDLQPPQQADLDWLKERFSPKAKALLNEADSRLKQRELMQGWTRQLWPTGGGFGARLDLPVSQKELKEFFDRDLNDQERAMLLSLPADDMQQRLKGLYLFRKAAPQNRRPDGRRRGGKQPKGPTATLDMWESPWRDWDRRDWNCGPGATC